GLRAKPSYARQESRGQKIDGMNYNWDLTIYSDGTMIDEGEYRAQIKSIRNAHWRSHPDICRLNTRTLFGVGPSEPELFVDFAEQIVDGVLTRRSPIDVMIAQRKLIGKLEKTGPAAPLT
ncbi:MAG: hypothetical protein JWN82_530, partial [Candidatus Saccharibacteria bacterium]|nr:hypothetical protein [Candidatus Saccharibacteria bacterium]